MFIDSLYLITVLATQCPEAITEVYDDYIIIDTNVCKDIIEELQSSVITAISSIGEIAYLPPLENEAETFVYPYDNTVKPFVHIARAHVKQDSKSSTTCSFNYVIFHKRFHDTGGFLGENPPFVCI
jgi:hypothetical protein